MPDTPLVRNVSDTAKWVAVYRAQESARSDALFRDPFAERLAGERGKAIVERVTRRTGSGWWMVVRTGSELASAPMHFAPEDGVAFFERLGWKAKDVFSVWRWALRWRRLPVWMRLFWWTKDLDPRNPGKAMWSGVVRFVRE